MRVVVARELCTVVAFHGRDQLVESLREVGRRRGQMAGQEQRGQVIRLRHDIQRALRAAGVRALALRVARSLASLRR